MIEYRYVAVTPDRGDQPLSWPLASHSDRRLANYVEQARRKYGKRATVRVDQREVTEWVEVGALL